MQRIKDCKLKRQHEHEGIERDDLYESCSHVVEAKRKFKVFDYRLPKEIPPSVDASDRRSNTIDSTYEAASQTSELEGQASDSEKQQPEMLDVKLAAISEERPDDAIDPQSKTVAAGTNDGNVNDKIDRGRQTKTVTSKPISRKYKQAMHEATQPDNEMTTANAWSVLAQKYLSLLQTAAGRRQDAAV